MTGDQIGKNIFSLIELEKGNKLNLNQTACINDILFAHRIEGGGARALFEIVEDFGWGELKRIGKILLENEVYLKCGICGQWIKNLGHYEIDRIISKAEGGGNSAENLQHSHKYCARIKDDLSPVVSFYAEPNLVAQYITSVEYALFMERLKIAKTREHSHTKTRPGGKCNHALWHRGRRGGR